MKRSYLELIFRHRVILAAPIVIAFLLGSFYGLQQPRSYNALTSIWTDAPVPEETTVGIGGMQAPPSMGQQALLNELLATREFQLDVAQHTPAGASLGGLSAEATDARLGSLLSGVSTGTAGPQVLTVFVKQSTPDLAIDIARSVATRFLANETLKLQARSQAQLEYDSKQLDQARKALSDAQTALMRYLPAHPEALTNPADGGAAELTGNVASAQQQYASAQQAYARDSATVAHIGDGTSLHIIDSPAYATATSRKRPIIFGAAAGLIAGFTISFVMLLILGARDNSPRTEADLEDALTLHVVGTVGEIPDQRPGAGGAGRVGQHYR